MPQEDRGGYSFWLAANIIELVTGPYSTLVYDEENQPIKLPGYRVDALTDAANRYLAAPRKNPFFLFFSLLEPHQQNDTDDYPAPDGYEEMYSNRWMPPDLQALGGSAPEHIGGYYGMVKRIDEAFGRILDVLKSTGQLDNTIILFTSDHGNHFKTRNDKYKRSVHESSIRIPGLLHGPGLAQGKRLTSLSSLIDLPATLLAAAGLPVPEHFAGRSLLPEINGEKKIASDDDYVIIQVSGSQHGRVIRTQRWKYAFTAPWEDAPQPQSYTESHLYDLENDPCELNNLIHCPEHQDIIAALREKLLNKLTEIGEPPIPIHTVFSEAEAERSI